MLDCQGCGVLKDPTVLELYPWDELYNEEPIIPLIEGISCESIARGPDGFATFRVCRVCHSCYHKLDVDMWISERCWLNLNPHVPFADLPLEK